tara:strand:+ start:571 stop:1758 length:1188 start_codon:yes stop_codon:yes gene_type:complete
MAATVYPGSLDSTSNLPSSISETANLNSPNHADMHEVTNTAIVQIETKVGTGSSAASDGALLHGTGSGISAWTSDPSIIGSLSVAKDSADAIINLTAHHDTEATAAELTLRKSDGSKASPALVDDDAVLGKIMFQGYDGNSWANGAQIRAQVKGTPANGDMPTEMIFMVTPDGGSETPATALTIAPDKTSTFTGPIVVGENDTGQDFTLWGAKADCKIYWDEGANTLNIGTYGGPGAELRIWGDSSSHSVRWLAGEGRLYVYGTFEVDGTFTLTDPLPTASSGGYATLVRMDSDGDIKEWTSSVRWKKDIEDLSTEEAYKVLDARPIKYRGLDDDDSAPLEAGLSAESLHDSGWTYAVGYDVGTKTPRSVHYQMLVTPLIKIIKDMNDRLKELEG